MRVQAAVVCKVFKVFRGCLGFYLRKNTLNTFFAETFISLLYAPQHLPTHLPTNFFDS